MKNDHLHDLQRIPGVGPSIADDLWKLGYKIVDDLIGADPQKIYEALCVLENCHVDRCVLYVFRCAVYFVSHQTHDPELLKWWNWKSKDSL